MANLDPDVEKNLFLTYAQCRDPSTEIKDILRHFTEDTITVDYPYPRSTYHRIIIPRIRAPPYIAPNLVNLRALLNSNSITKQEALDLILAMKRDAEQVKADIEREMTEKYKFKWDVLMAFNPVPFHDHLHMHIYSNDMVGEYLKTRAHYNAYNPDTEYFITLEELLGWFEAVDSMYNDNKKIDEREYKKRLDADLECFHCTSMSDRAQKSMKALKAHLLDHFEREKAKGLVQAKVKEKVLKQMAMAAEKKAKET